MFAGFASSPRLPSPLGATLGLGNLNLQAPSSLAVSEGLPWGADGLPRARAPEADRRPCEGCGQQGAPAAHRFGEIPEPQAGDARDFFFFFNRLTLEKSLKMYQVGFQHCNSGILR